MLAYRDVKGLKIACWINDAGIDQRKKSLVFLAGSGQDHTAWTHQLAALTQDFNCIGIDLPGHGESAGQGEQSVDAYVDWVKEILAAFSIEHPCLAGHSLGGAICLCFALKYGNLVSGIVPLGSGMKMPVNPMIFDMLKKDPETLAATTWKWSVSKKNRERLAPYFAARSSNRNPDTMYGDFLACDRLDLTGTVSQIKSPTLLICGADDKMTPLSLTEQLRDLIPGAQMVVIPDAGHLVMIEAPEAFNDALKTFVNALS